MMVGGRLIRWLTARPTLADGPRAERQSASESGGRDMARRSVQNSGTAARSKSRPTGSVPPAPKPMEPEASVELRESKVPPSRVQATVETDSSRISEAEVAELAYEKWLARGCAHGF